jgi:hypothetical protein
MPRAPIGCPRRARFRTPPLPAARPRAAADERRHYGWAVRTMEDMGAERGDRTIVTAELAVVGAGVALRELARHR